MFVVRFITTSTVSIFFLGLFVLNSLYALPPRNQYPTGTVTDERYNVGHPSFFFKYDPSGTKKIVEVLFHINNKVNKVLNLRVLVIGLHEKNKIDPLRRKFVPYPPWRSLDFEKEIRGVTILDSVPLLPEEILSTNQHAYFTYQQVFYFIKVFTMKGKKFVQGKDYLISMFTNYTFVNVSLEIKDIGPHLFFNHIVIIIYDQSSQLLSYRQVYQLKTLK